jgi:Arginine/serine-rich protein PNISR
MEIEDNVLQRNDYVPIKIPNPPIINAAQMIEEQSNLVDMEIESEEDGVIYSVESQKKKQLPVWLRDGLEKIKREKLIKDLKYQEKEKLKEDEERRKQMMAEALKELEQEKKCKYVNLK